MGFKIKRSANVSGGTGLTVDRGALMAEADRARAKSYMETYGELPPDMRAAQQAAQLSAEQQKMQELLDKYGGLENLEAALKNPEINKSAQVETAPEEDLGSAIDDLATALHEDAVIESTTDTTIASEDQNTEIAKQSSQESRKELNTVKKRSQQEDLIKDNLPTDGDEELVEDIVPEDESEDVEPDTEDSINEGFHETSEEGLVPLKDQITDALSTIQEMNSEKIESQDIIDALKSMVGTPEKAEELESALEGGDIEGEEPETTDFPEEENIDEEAPIEEEVTIDEEIPEDEEKLPAELMLHERKAFSAKLQVRSPRSESLWVLAKGKTPVMTVTASQAFGKTLFKAPAPGEYPMQFASYYDVFVHPMYGKTLAHQADVAGLAKACASACGTLIKTAQVGSAAPQSTNEQPQPETNSTPGGSTAGMEDLEGEPDGTFNPSPESEDLMGAEEPTKMLISDMMIDWLAPQVANDTYSVEEVMNELKATFQDDDAAKEFEGSLQEKADSLKEETGEKKEEEAEEGSDDSLMNNDLPEDANADAAMEGDEGMGAQPKPLPELQAAAKKIETLESQVEKIASERTLAYKAKVAHDFVTEVMQRRGTNGKPVVATVETLMATGMTKAAAVEQEKKIVASEVRKLLALGDEAFVSIKQAYLSLPEIEEPAKKTASAEDEKFAQMRKEAAAQLPVYLESNPEPATGLDAILGDTGRGRYTDLAAKHSEYRKTKKTWH